MALVHGTPPENGDWEDLLWKDSKQNKVFVVKRMRGGVKKARLEFVRLSAGEESLVRIRLHTGRSHQIRVQFASRGYPLVGDHKYGSRDEKTEPMLFSCRLTFPFRGSQRQFEKLPGNLKEAALAREAEPEASLTELAAMMDPPITKPAMNNRMKKLMKIAEEGTV